MHDPSAPSSDLDAHALSPVKRTIEAGDQLRPPPGESALQRELRRLRAQVADIAPGCVGISMVWSEDGALCTLVASDESIAVLDALQYLAGDGPAAHVVAHEQGVEASTASLERAGRWRDFSGAALERGAHSILVLPLSLHGHVSGAVTFYGAGVEAFTGNHDAVGDVLEAWAPDALHLAASPAPVSPDGGSRRLRDEGLINRAMGTIATTPGVDVVTAKDRLVDAAVRAGIKPAVLAEALLRQRT